MKRLAFVAMAIMASGTLASAQDVSATEEADASNSVTISLSPLHLLLPVVEAEGEFKVTPEIGAAVILGGGQVTATKDGTTITATAYEAGAQLNYYFLRPFSGLHVGIEGIYASAGDVMQDSSLSGTGFSVGPYLGYKVQTNLGFAFIAQGGAQYIAAKAESSSTGAMKSGNQVAPLLNLNVGWSF